MLCGDVTTLIHIPWTSKTVWVTVSPVTPQGHTPWLAPTDMEDNGVANTPTTRPPNRSPQGRRPPEGPTPVPPRRRVSYELARARLATGAEHLRAQDSKELKAAAETIDQLLGPRGWEILRRPSPASQRERDPNMPLWMNKAIKDYLQEMAAHAAREEFDEMTPEQRREAGLKAPKGADTFLAEVVEEGYRKFLAGEFVPEKPLRTMRGSGTEKQNLNVRPSKELRDQVDAVCGARSKELGWDVSPGLVAMAWLYAEYGITDDQQRGVSVPAIPDHIE